MKRYLFLTVTLVLFSSLAVDAFAATYYVKNGGNDSNTGLSDAQAWATISKVRNAGLATNSCVYFKCGDTWNTKTDATLRIDWSGTDDNNRAIIGAYYMDSGNEVIGVNGDGKPVLDGDWDTSNDFQAIINPYDAHYLLIQDFELYNSYGLGFLVHALHPCSYITLRRLRIDYTGRSSINFSSCGTGGIIEYCNTSRDNIRWHLGSISAWGSGIKIKSHNCTVRHNEVHEGYGEGINVGVGDKVNNVIVENNLVWAMQSIGIYIDGSRDGIVRNNVVFGTTDTTFHKSSVYGGRTWNAPGIMFNNETTNDSSLRNKVYGNVVIGCSRGIQSLNKTGEVVGYDNRQLVYNNTLIDNYANFYVNPNECNNTEFKNNLSVVHNDAITRTDTGNGHVYFKTIHLPDCYLPLGNMWSGPGNNDVGDWSHAADVVGDARLFKTSGWQNISTPSDIDIAQSFALTVGSAAIDSAQNLGATYNAAFLEGTDFNVADASDALTPIVVVLGDQDNHGAGWEMGAFVYAEGVGPVCNDGFCTGDETCSTCPEDCGVCVEFCAEGFTDCDGSCVDLETNTSHCGSCDNACASGVVCVNGECWGGGASPGCGCVTMESRGGFARVFLGLLLLLMLGGAVRRRKLRD